MIWCFYNPVVISWNITLPTTIPLMRTIWIVSKENPLIVYLFFFCSMEECENLCDRLTIMSKGRMKCIGTAQHLKQRYAQGFSILIKTRDLPAREEENSISVLKQNMENAFGRDYCILKDEHKVSLCFSSTKPLLGLLDRVFYYWILNIFPGIIVLPNNERPTKMVGIIRSVGTYERTSGRYCRGLHCNGHNFGRSFHFIRQTGVKFRLKNPKLNIFFQFFI